MPAEDIFRVGWRVHVIFSR